MSSRSIARDGVLRGGVAVVVRLCLLVAIAISAYLLSVSLSGGKVVGCGAGSDCDSVLQSRWAYIFGLPVSVLALVVDGALLLTTFSCGPRSSATHRRAAWEILLPGSLLVLGAALWFMAIQAVVLHAFCPWCITAHACGSIAAILLLVRIPIRDTAQNRDKDPAVSRSGAWKLAAVALILVACFAIGQIALAPKTFSVKAVPAAPTNEVVFFDVYGGAVKLDLAQVPVWGSVKAPFKMLSLHDYSCKHCAQMHSRVVELQREFSNRLAVISVPMPLDGKCNPAVVRTPRDHTNACAYARLGLAVWRARRDALVPYEDWFFEAFNRNAHPPTLLEATNRAIELVGGLPRLEQASRDPWIEQQLGADVAIFGISMKQYRNGGSMPQFIIGSNLVSGPLQTEQLRKFIADYVH